MSAGALHPSRSDANPNPHIKFFRRAITAFKRAERDSHREAPSYTPIGLILQALVDACTSPDEGHDVFLDIQPRIKGPDDAECSPDFSAMLLATWKNTDSNTEPTLEDFLIWFWEVKLLDVECSWFGDGGDEFNKMTSRAQQSLKSYLRQLSQQALFAFHQFKGDTVPGFLSQGNFFTLLLYPRPSNWDALSVKYADTLKRGPRQSIATGTPMPENSNATTSQGQEESSGSQEQETAPDQQEVPAAQELAENRAEPVADQNAGMPRRDRNSDTNGRRSIDLAQEGTPENIKDTAASSAGAHPSASTGSAEPLFEDGDYPIPSLFCSCENIMLPDGSGFSPQFLKAQHIAMAFRGVTFNPLDSIFCLPGGLQLDDIPMTRPLAAAQEVIDDFKKEQEASKNLEQSCSATSLASSHVEYKASRYAIIRPLDGKLWSLRRGRQVMYKSPPRKAARKEPAARRQPAKKPGPKRAKSSKKTIIDQSRDAPTAYDHVNANAGPSDAHVNAVAGPSNARLVPLRPPAHSGMQVAGPSKKRKLDQVQEDTAVPVSADEGAGPSKKRSAAPRSRPVRFASQDVGPSERRGLKPSGDALATDVLVNNTAAGPSDEQLTGRSAEASARNEKDPGQPSRKGKERAH